MRVVVPPVVVRVVVAVERAREATDPLLPRHKVGRVVPRVLAPAADAAAAEQGARRDEQRRCVRVSGCAYACVGVCGRMGERV